jgi:diguanylate cyclase (GGDEF)-like protein/PAS domain S-box-containing protein
MVGTVQDVTTQRAAQEQLALAAKVLENSIEGVIITDAHGRIQSVNRAFTIITGFLAEEVLGRGLEMLRSGHHDEGFYAGIQQSLAANGEWRGEVWHRSKNGQDYPQWMTITTVKDDQGRIANQVILLHDISDLRRSEEELRYYANHDTLTGLPNRQLLRDRLEVALAGSERRNLLLAVLYVDLDNFKTINDSLGHAAGDALLQAVANRLLDLCRGRHTVARLGGDDFVVVLEDLEDQGQAERQAKALLESLARPFWVDNQEFYLTTSLGLAFSPPHGRQPETLIKNAELAMHRAKERGKNAYLVYTPTMNAVALKRLSLETALRKALEREEFEVHYQPRVDAAAGRMLGMEALVRWRRPEVGLVSPGDFIPLAEETGLIVPIGGWVLRQACQQTRAWLDQGHRDLVVAVNLSARQLRHASLAATVESALSDSGLPPANLELELTESALMTNVERGVVLLQTLARMGLRLVLDDFGTGYSSLYYLKRFPIQALKIDQHFVADIFNDPGDAAIVQAVISLAQSLKLGVVAEGVETAAQRDFLLARGCHEMQGYLFSRPVPAQELQLLLDRERSRFASANPWAARDPLPTDPLATGS